MSVRVDFDRLNAFLPLIATLPSDGKLLREQLLDERFRLYSESRLTIYYAPFDYIKDDARIAIVGITPGWTQMEIAYRTAKLGLVQDKSLEEICSDIEQTASFAGSMRANLVRMLDELSLPDMLGVPSSAVLFGTQHHLVHTTSAIRYPVFVDGKNYTGHHPDVLKHAKLREYVSTLFAEELEQVPDALVVPLGEAVSQVLGYLVSSKRLESERCLLSFPHPSGANGHRKKQFEARKDVLKSRVLSWFEP